MEETHSNMPDGLQKWRRRKLKHGSLQCMGDCVGHPSSSDELIVRSEDRQRRREEHMRKYLKDTEPPFPISPQPPFPHTYRQKLLTDQDIHPKPFLFCFSLLSIHSNAFSTIRLLLTSCPNH